MEKSQFKGVETSVETRAWVGKPELQLEIVEN